MLVENNTTEFQQNSLCLQKYCSPQKMESAKLNINYNVKENFGESDFSDYEEQTSIDFNNSIDLSGQKQTSDENLDIDILQIKCREMVNFSDKIKQIDSFPLDISYKIQMIQALKEQLTEKLQDQQSFRHLMRKKVSKQQKQNDSNMTKTTAAYSIASTITSIPQMNTRYMRSNTIAEIPYSIINNTQFTNMMSTTSQNNQEDIAFSKRCSIISVQPQNMNSARKEGIFGSPFYSKADNIFRIEKRNSDSKLTKQKLLEQCYAIQKDIKKHEKSLVPKKDERNRISEQLEDQKEDLIVIKQYLRELASTEEQKQIQTENLIKKINSMSRKGFTMNNRENNTSTTLNTSKLNASFVDDAFGKMKAFKDFFKVKIFTQKEISNQGQLFGQYNSRGNSQTQLPVSNRILDFN